MSERYVSIGCPRTPPIVLRNHDSVMRLKRLVKASVMQGRTLDQQPRTTQRSRCLGFAAHFVDQPCVFLAVHEVKSPGDRVSVASTNARLFTSSQIVQTPQRRSGDDSTP